ncbi:MAG TPA: SDR family oxidoreductase [Steroidobacteraceae bacterium]|nr:SDR family oxidoreductase [Steroidobacteraceae bacterium]HNS26666.1 SDR family oxidoreductase [Steroidobacteraceae bacterium]
MPGRTLATLTAAVLVTAMTTAYAADAPTVLITGANRGLGLEFARQYAARGWQVIATARRPAEATALAELAAAHPGVSIETLDVTDGAAIEALAMKLRGQAIDVLLHNAGITGARAGHGLGSFDYDLYRRVLETNAIGPMRLTEALLDNVAMSRQKKIVTISSSEGSITRVDAPRGYWYRSSKAAVNMLMRNLAFEVRKRGITVVLVNPGPVDTDMMKGVRMPLQPVPVAAATVIRIIDGVALEETGRFWDYQGGELPW